jgi:hypothetical protein
MLDRTETVVPWRKIPWAERPWMVYLIVQQVQPDAQPLTIRAEIVSRHGCRVSLGWLYETLNHFEKNGYLRVESRLVFDPQALSRSARPALFYFPTSKRCPDKKSSSTSIGDWRLAT